MKKRIKLTDEELAIGMWVYIYLEISKELKADDVYLLVRSVNIFKRRYLKAHGLGEYYWYNCCLLCQRYLKEGEKCKCPLSEDGKDCGDGSLYKKASLYYVDRRYQEEAIEACKEIIKIMIKEADKKYEVENS